MRSHTETEKEEGWPRGKVATHKQSHISAERARDKQITVHLLNLRCLSTY